MAEPSPAPAWITTECPSSTSSRTPAGVSATRYSSGLISRGDPDVHGRPPRAAHLPGRLLQHRPEHALHLLEVLVGRDQRRRQLDHRVAAVIRAADEPAAEELAGEEPAQQDLGLLVVEARLRVAVLDQLDAGEVARPAHVADDRDVAQRRSIAWNAGSFSRTCSSRCSRSKTSMLASETARRSGGRRRSGRAGTRPCPP